MTVLAFQPRETTVEDEGMADLADRPAGDGSRYAGPERRDEPKPGAWSDPKTWLGILSLLLTIGILVGGAIAKQLSDMNAHLQAMEVAQGKTNTHNEDEIKRIDGSMGTIATKQSNDETNQNAYNFRMQGELTEIITTLKLRGFPTPSAPPPPPQLGGN